MNFLEEQFKKSPNNKVRTVITNIFEGDRQYETRCSKCDKTSIREDKFHELELSMDSNTNSSLKSSLKSLIKAEKLQGDNKYRCDDCGLVDATRKMNLTRLPIILNVQLLRFVYNPQTGNKAKLTIPYSFPRVLDMSPYITGYLFLFCHPIPLIPFSPYIIHKIHEGIGGLFIFNPSFLFCIPKQFIFLL